MKSSNRHSPTPTSVTLATVALCLCLAGCSRSGDAAASLAAVAELQPAAGSTVAGKVTFTQLEAGVRVVAEVTGLTPGDHGFHVHEKGDLSAPDLTSAGGHYNPTHAAHAGRDADARHAGDMGNIVADERGVAHLDYVDKHLTLTGESSIVGRAVIVHATADDLTSQPSGNAGARVAGGVIKLQAAP